MSYTEGFTSILSFEKKEVFSHQFLHAHGDAYQIFVNIMMFG